MPRKPLLLLAAALAATISLWLAWRWQPDVAARHRFEALLRATEDRDFDDLEELFDPAYADRWGMDRTTVLREGREVLRQFFALSIAPDPAPPAVRPGAGPRERVIETRLRIDGTGTPIAELAKSEVNRIDTAWVFTLRRADWKPWNWRLVRLDNPGIDLSRHIEGW